MLEIVLGALVVIGVFVFWCDVTDSWNNVFLWNKTGKHCPPSALVGQIRQIEEGSVSGSS
jgi:hypothetical protein